MPFAGALRNLSYYIIKHESLWCMSVLIKYTTYFTPVMSSLVLLITGNHYCHVSQTDSTSSSETEGNIEDIFGVKPSIEAQRDHPPNLELDSGVVDICFHPSLELISTATMDGEVMM